MYVHIHNYRSVPPEEIELPAEVSRLSHHRVIKASFIHTNTCVAALIGWPSSCCTVWQCVAVCCSALRSGAACCSVLQRVAVCLEAATRCNTLQHAATRCNTLYLSKVFHPPPLPLQTQKLSIIRHTTARELMRRNNIHLSSKTSKEPYTFAKEPHTSVKETTSPPKRLMSPQM